MTFDAVNAHEAGDTRVSPLAIDEAQFRALGHTLVDRIASWQATSSQRPMAQDATPAELRALLGDSKGGLPASGIGAQVLLDDTTRLLLDHAPGHHPRLHGYISAAPAPIGVLAELLAAALNANVALWHAAPLAAEIETQTVHWLAELVSYQKPGASGIGGLLTSGGTQANAMALQLALTARIADRRERGLEGAALAVYASDQTHGWLPQAVEQAGLGRQAVRFLSSDARQRIDMAALEARLAADVATGVQPLMVVGNAGTVGTGAVDPLRALAALCRRHGAWFHVDGAYGAAAACLVGSTRESLLGDAAADLAALSEADSLSLDPHKWLYAPIEAGCLLVREPHRLADTFGDEPSYYGAPHADAGISFHRLGPQNTRGFRALKVWLALRMAGRDGYRQMIGDDIALASRLFEHVARTPRLEALTQQLSITSFRYVFEGSREATDDVNRSLLARWQREGSARLSPVTIAGRPALRACLVNHQTTAADVDAAVAMVVALGDALKVA